MLLGISQPVFMPWIGYFALLNYLDKIIFLDDVQFDKRSWQQRNNIKINNKKHLITIPVKTKNKFHQKICDVEILYDKSLEEIKKKILYTYKNANYFKNYSKDLFNILDKKHNYLFELNIELIQFFLRALDLKVDIDFSSKYKIDLKKEKLIFELCKLNKCKKYISTVGSKNYLNGYEVIPNTNIQISFFEYKDIKYNQLGDGFIPKLSILDLLFNEGENSINVIQKGFKILK